MLTVIDNRTMKPVATVADLDTALAWAETVPFSHDFSVVKSALGDLVTYTMAELRCLHGHLTRDSYLSDQLTHEALMVKIREALDAQVVTTALPPAKACVAPLNQAAWEQLMSTIKKHTNAPAVYADAGHHTCVLLKEASGQVEYLPLSIENKLAIQVLPAKQFHAAWQRVEYPVRHAVRLYVEYARSIGATEVTLDALDQIIPLTNEDKTMSKKAAAAKKISAPKGKTTKTTKAKGKAKKTVATTIKAPRESAASLFKELIMEGTHTDDEIFVMVQKRFNLGDEKRSYVAWYRNWLKKDGQNPPAAIKAEKA